MACPLVAGSAALVREWLQKKRNISNPDGATIKAILLAGAKSLAPGQYGTGKTQEIPNSYPNNVEGWGQVNLGNSLQNSVGLLVYDAKVIEQGKTHTFTVKATAGNALNIVMAYTDAPGNPGSGKALVNNLDLLVKTPSGKLIYPNSGTSADNLNNVEGVRIAAADVVSGTYTITVTGTSIPTGMATSLTGGKSNASRYSLVVNGATETNVDIPPDAPANDNVANAVAISAQSGSTSGSNVSATKDDGNIGGLASVWWKWTPTKNGTATFDTDGSAFDTTLMVYTKYANGTYKLERENNDATTTVSYSRVSFEATAGTTYYVAVGGSSGKTGNLKLNWSLQVVQKSDLCFALGSDNSSWPAAVFLSGTRGSATKTATFKNKQTIYSYWSVKNSGNVAPKSSSVLLHEILKSGTVVQSWTENLSAVAAGYTSSRSNNPDSHFKNLGEGSYTYRITLDSQNVVDELNESNNQATYSFTVSAPEPLTAPTGLTVSETTTGSNYVTLRWNSVDGVRKYYVYRSTTSTCPAEPWRTVSTVSQTRDGTCKAGTRYYYWVAAVDDGAISPVSASATIVTANDGVLASFTASATVSGASISLSWSAADSWNRGFYVYRSEDPIMPDSHFAEVDNSTTQYNDSTAVAGVTYYYWIAANHMLAGEVVAPMVSATIPVQKPDLQFFAFTGWPAAAFLSVSSDEMTKAATFKSGQTIYLWSCWGNYGYVAVPDGWKIRHQVLDAVFGSVVAESESTLSGLTDRTHDGSAAAYQGTAVPILQNLSAGRYTYRAILDAGGDIDESDESNNVVAFDFEVVNESCDFQYCGYTGWLAHLFLSPSDSDGEYLPVHRYAVGGSPNVNFGIVNWAKTTCLCRKLDWRIFDAAGNLMKDSEVEWNRAFDENKYFVRSIGWQWPCAFENLEAGTYRLQIVFDSGKDANDTDRSNNTNFVLFAVTNVLNKTIASAVEADNLTFMTSGANPPFVQMQITSDGADAVQFGPAAPNETNTLSTVVTGPGKLSFKWFCACESVGGAEGHKFAFSVDGVQNRRIYGDGRPDNWKWISYSCDIPSGRHTLTWTYCKDAYADKYLDSAWLDQVSWVPSITPASPSAKSISGDESGIKISFGALANATAYRIYRATAKVKPGDCYDEIPATTGTSLEYSDISAEPGVEYHYWISAVGTGGESSAVYCGMTYRVASIGASPDAIEFDANGGERNITVWANTEWEVQSKPNWITATKATVQADDRTEVVLKIVADATSSERDGSIKLIVAKGTAHSVVSSDIHISQSDKAGPMPPTWTPATKEDTLVVYASVFDTSANAAMEADGTRLGAFAANGECRGWATVMDGPSGRLFQLSIGVENATESGIVLKVWNPETGEISEIAERISCNSDKQIGAIANPKVFKVGSAEMTLSLNVGWNWVATSLVTDDATVGGVFGDFTFADEDVVKSASGFATYYSGTWYPSSTDFRIEPGRAYCVKKSAGGSESVTLSGSVMEDGILVSPGWNWIGPTSLGDVSISAVSHTGMFADEDIVKDASHSATYYGGQWWSDGSFVFRPGVGYKAKLARAGTLSFSSGGAANTAAANAGELATSAKAATANRTAPDWTPVVLDDTMIAYLQIAKSDGSKFETDGCVLAAFAADGECRGKASIGNGPNNSCLFQLSIAVASSTESGITLKLWDVSSQSIYEIDGEIANNEAGTIGKIYAPSVMSAVEPTSVCTVTFAPNGGNGTMANQTVTKNVATRLNKCAFTKTGCSFKQWSGSDGKTYSDQQSVTLSADLALTAQWMGNVYRVTVDLQGGSGGSSYVDATYGAAMPSITKPTRSGYDFGGYFTGANGVGTQYYDATGAGVRAWDKTSGATLYAYWIERETSTCTVTFLPGEGGVGYMAPQEFDDGTAKKLSYNRFERSGYVFLCWKDQNGRNYENGEEIEPASDLTLTALWANKLAVNCYAQSEQSKAKGTVTRSPKDAAIKVGATVSLTAKAANNNTVFAYWTDADGSIVTDSDDMRIGFAATVKVKPDELENDYYAVFRLKSSCKRPVLDSDYPYGDGYESANSMVGVAYKAQIVVNEDAYPVKFSANGLPPGLKINATTGIISGVPTKAGTYKATITVLSAANPKLKPSSAKLPITIAKLPAWARGTFNGRTFVYGAELADGNTNGVVKLTVGATGKISGKIALGGTNWTISVSSYSADSDADREIFTANGTASAVIGKKTYKMPWSWEIVNPGGEYKSTCGEGTLGNVDEYGDYPAVWSVVRDIWNDAGAKSELVGDGYWQYGDRTGAYVWYTPAGEKLTLIVSANGTVKVAGTLLNGRKISLSTMLLYNFQWHSSASGDPFFDDSPRVAIYAPPQTVTTKDKKGKVIRKTSYKAFFAEIALENEPGTPVLGEYIAYRKQGVRAAIDEESDGTGTIGYSVAYGQAQSNATVTVTAKAAKGSVFAYWLLDGDIVGYGASYKAKMGGGDFTGLTAVFRKASEFTTKPDIPYVVIGKDDEGNAVNPFDSLRVGVSFRARVDLDPECRPVKFTAKNLPAGLALNATTGVISGVPTAAGSKTISITATSVANTKLVSSALKIPVAVPKLPAWATGTFTGKGDLNGKSATATLTVGATGKISGKFTVSKKSYAFTAGSYSEYDGAFSASAKLAYGKATYPVIILVDVDGESGKGFALLDVMFNDDREGQFGSAEVWRK